MKTPKELVICAFLDFVSRQVPLTEARLATLGGKGMEAKLWTERGIPFDHGWLIEHNRSKGMALIAEQRYRISNQLSSFCHILNGTGETAIDGFHLDLCGTFRPSVEKFAPVLPFIIGSKGKCLAITLADARRSLVTDNWDQCQAFGGQVLGKAFAEALFSELHEKQRLLPTPQRPSGLPKFIKPFDPLKAARREFGFLVDLLALLEKRGHQLPTEVERYVYVSRYQKPHRPFRMRSYFVHFGREKMTPKSFAQKWMTSPLYFVNEAGIVGVGKTTGEQTQPMSKLESLVNLIGGEILTEFGVLKADADRFRAARAIFENNSGQGESTPEPVSSGGGQANDVPPRRPSRGRPLKPDTGGKKDWFDYTEQEKIRFVVRIFEFKAQSGGDWALSREKFLQDEFGYSDLRLSKSVRATMAIVRRDWDGYKARILSTLPHGEATKFAERLTKALG